MVDILNFILARYNYWIVIILMMTGLYIVFSRGNLVKTIVGLNIFQTSVFIFYITIGKVAGGTAPILLESDQKKGGYGDDAHGEGGYGEGAYGADHGEAGELVSLDQKNGHGGEAHGGAAPAEPLHGGEPLSGEEAAAYARGERVNEIGALQAADLPSTPGAPTLHDAPDAAVNALGGRATELPPAQAEMLNEAVRPVPVGDPPGVQTLDVVREAGEVLYSNPLPHVLILTAIVVGVATTAVGLALAVRIREAYGTVEEDALEAMDNAADFGRANGEAAQ
jgi:multicomponent Na+:H+ antiporter subunit C